MGFALHFIYTYLDEVGRYNTIQYAGSGVFIRFVGFYLLFILKRDIRSAKNGDVNAFNHKS